MRVSVGGGGRGACFFGFRGVESDAVVDKAPFHVFFVCRTEVETEGAGRENAVMLV